MTHRTTAIAGVVWMVALAAGCGTSPGPDQARVTGRRVQATTMVAGSSLPYQAAAYEFVFSGQDGVAHARRAAVLVNLVSGHGHVQGFAEWGRAGEAPSTYVVGGWAQQRVVDGDLVTVLNLGLDRVGSRRAGSQDATEPETAGVRLVVNELSGDVAMTRLR